MQTLYPIGGTIPGCSKKSSAAPVDAISAFFPGTARFSAAI